MATFTGTSGSDNLDGTSGNDSFNMGQGGNDTVKGEAGNDIFDFGAAFTAGDRIDGGTGADVLVLDGDYSAGVTLLGSTMVNVEQITLRTGNSYNLTTDNATTPGGQTLAVNGSALTSADSLRFSNAADTDGRLYVIGGAGADSLTGGAGADAFHLENGGNDTASGNGGDDVFYFGGAFTAADSVNGGAGSDRLYLAGNYAAGVSLLPATVTNVESIAVAAGNDYKLTTADATVASGQTLSIDASALGSANKLTFSNAADTDGRIFVTGGAGNDVLTGGAGADRFHLEKGGNDSVSGGAGSDTFYFGGAFNSGDQVNGGTGTDFVSLDGDYSAGLTLSGTMLNGVEDLSLVHGHSYKLTATDAAIAAGATLYVDGSTLGAADVLTFNALADSDGRVAITGGAASDDLAGGAGNDVLIGNGGNNRFHLEFGGSDTATGGSGNDIFYLGATLSAGDKLTGGGGNDLMLLDGDYSAGVAVHLTDIDRVALAAGHNYKLQFSADGLTTVDGSALGTANSLTFTASTGTFRLVGGAGNDTLVGNGTTSIDLSRGGEDTASKGLFNFGAAYDSGDTVSDGHIILDGAYAPLTFDGSNTTNIGKLSVGGDFDYNITLNGIALPVFLSALGPGDTLAVTHSSGSTTTFYAGGGNETYQGLSQDRYSAANGAGTLDITNGAIVYFGGALNSHDAVHNVGTVDLNGDYSAGVTLGAGSLTNIGTLQFEPHHNYDITLGTGSDVGSILGSPLAAGDNLRVDASVLTSASFRGGAGNDTFIGGDGANTFDLRLGGSDTAIGGSGADLFRLSGNLSATEVLHIDGGAGNDQVDYSGPINVVLGAASSIDVENMDFHQSSGSFIANDGAVAAGKTLNITGENVDGFTFDGSGETDGHFNISVDYYGHELIGGQLSDTISAEAGGITLIGNGGDDTLSIGAFYNQSGLNYPQGILEGDSGNDTLYGDGGGGVFNGGAGADHIDDGGVQDGAAAYFAYDAVTDSSSTSYDTIVSVDFDLDRFDLPGSGQITGIDTAFTGGTLDNGPTFDTELAADLAGHLNAHHAILFTVQNGGLAGQTFLVADVNGSGAYEANQDLVVHLQSWTGTLTSGDFI